MTPSINKMLDYGGTSLVHKMHPTFLYPIKILKIYGKIAVFVNKDVRFFYAASAKSSASLRPSFGGFSHTSATGSQFLIMPDHRLRT